MIDLVNDRQTFSRSFSSMHSLVLYSRHAERFGTELFSWLVVVVCYICNIGMTKAIFPIHTLINRL